MQLIATLKAANADQDSFFRAQLLKEDIARLCKLQELAASCATLDEFKKEGLYIGWTQSDMKTHQIKDVIEDFLTLFHSQETGEKTAQADAILEAAWRKFDTARMEKLVGCL